MPLVWASRLQGTPLPARVAGSDLISSLSAAAAGEGRSIFLLGGDNGTAQAAANVLRDRYPQLVIAGTLCPPLGFENDEAAMRRITAVLEAARPDIVYVALGSPKQERLIDRIRPALPKAWWLGVGVSFSFLCGEVKRAPLWMRNWGLEWIHRLAQEPRRLFRRYVIAGIPFATMLLLQSALRGARNRLKPRRPEGAVAGYENQAQTLARASAAQGVSSADTAESVNEIATELEAAGAQPAQIALESTPSHQTPVAAPAGRGRLRGLVLLGGGVRPTPLAMSLNRNVLDLPVGKGKTVLTRWLDEAAIVAQMLGMDHLPVRLLLDQDAPQPLSAISAQASASAKSQQDGNGVSALYRLERDTAEYRGTGGLLANIAVDYDDDDTILIGNAAQILLDPLSALLTWLKKARGVVSLIGHLDGEPSGLMLITCRACGLFRA
jgi:N-acetylglucosaminyldiphosphoundecaprenol N-acetyl-beta-D-mannosaminyltransferase